METRNNKAAIVCLAFLVISFSAFNSSWTTHSEKTVLITSIHSHADVYAEFMDSLPASYTEVSELQNDTSEFTVSLPASSSGVSEIHQSTSGIAFDSSGSDFENIKKSYDSQQIHRPVKHVLASSKDVGRNLTTMSNFLDQMHMSIYIPHLNEITIVCNWAEMRRRLGHHFGYGIAVVFLGFCTWVYVRYVRPKLSRQESHHLDENNVIASLFLLPAEEILFYEDQSQSDSWWDGLCSGCGIWSRCFKLAVTNKRLIAQRQESTFFGTCMLGSREESWPIENVSKISLLTGEFWGLTLPTLWAKAFHYFAATLVLDLFSRFVQENIQELLGGVIKTGALDAERVSAAVRTFLSVACNLLFLAAVMHSLAVMALAIFPQTLIKVVRLSVLQCTGSFQSEKVVQRLRAIP